MEDRILREFILKSLTEDLGDGDHTSLSCIPSDAKGKAKLLIKENGILAGMRVAAVLFPAIDKDLKFDPVLDDGTSVTSGDIAFNLSGKQQSILKSERLVLNIMQRMSGIATSTNKYVTELKGLKTRILDTRKTTPGFRFLEKEAVRIGGGINHRMGLFDMILIKDNHIDYAGGVENSIRKTQEYLRKKNLNLKVEIEARSLQDVKTIIATGGIDRILLDNFSIEETRISVKEISGRYETESSGGIDLTNIRAYAECGVDYVSVGALTHHVNSLDMSLKAIR